MLQGLHSGEDLRNAGLVVGKRIVAQVAIAKGVVGLAA